jgi:hypothetical protein
MKSDLNELFIKSIVQGVIVTAIIIAAVSIYQLFS